MSPQGCLNQFSNLALQTCSINGPDNWKRLHWLENCPFARTNSNDRNFFIIQNFWMVFLAYDFPWCHLKFLFTNQELITRRKSPKFECVGSHFMNFDLISNNSRLISRIVISSNYKTLRRLFLLMVMCDVTHGFIFKELKENCAWKNLKVIKSS